MAYSMDLRERVVAAVADRHAIAVVARRYGVSRPTVRLWRDWAAANRLAAGTPGPKSPTKLTPADDQLMREQIAKNPGITALQLQPMLSVKVVECTICRRLKNPGLSLQKSR